MDALTFPRKDFAAYCETLSERDLDKLSKSLFELQCIATLASRKFRPAEEPADGAFAWIYLAMVASAFVVLLL